MDERIGRRRLPHDIPLWIDPSQSVYFLTFCCEPRGENHVCQPDIAQALFSSFQYRQNKHQWYAHLFLLMPDHVHALIRFPPSNVTIHETISRWKSWTASQYKIPWQTDFFEHRLRRDESLQKKADYILANPVRAGLAKKPEDWPYVWIPD